MTIKIKSFVHILFFATFVVFDCFASSGTVSRSAVNTEHARAVGTINNTVKTVSRTKQPTVLQRNTSSRVAKNVSTKRVEIKPNRSATTIKHVSRAGTLISNAGNAIVQRAFGLSRSAKKQFATIVSSGNCQSARSAVPMGASRARATAVFSDTSKLGDGYNNCREAYNTCMDQFCAAANDTYRRCYCSNTFQTFRDKEEALDEATTLLAQFENNNLNAVDKTAEEVSAMYSATAGEEAIKNDTSGAAELLSNISDLLSGKKKTIETTNTSMTSLGSFSLDFSSDLGDIFGDNSSTNSLFNDSSSSDLSAMEGVELYNNAHNQCMQVVSSVCEAGAVRNMAKSAYSILITQDCNAYQKKIDSKTEQVKTTVRTAEKYLREARLEEYRAHNSADVNECLDKVETALLQSTACGADYAKCLDYTGVYINSSTGDPIYSPRLFKLNELIVLDGTSDNVLTQNPEFAQFLESKRIFAKTALDSCRDIADTVWSEFKRSALIKISQAQDEKIEEVKMSCVSTMKECYDTQSGELKAYDDTTAQASGALAARAARDMCSDKVLACATLYGDTDGCQIDTKTNKVTAKSGKNCGLSSLLRLVDTVDDVRIAEGCATAVENYLKDLCTPTTGDEGYPWNCRLRKFGTVNKDGTVVVNWDDVSGSASTITQMVANYAYENCGLTSATGGDATRIKSNVEETLYNLREELADMIGDKCEEADGIWLDAASKNELTNGDVVENFYNVVFGKSYKQAQSDYGINSWGVCRKNSIKARCEALNTSTGDQGYATYDEENGKCNFTIEYYQYQCKMVDGIWDDTTNTCYIAK